MKLDKIWELQTELNTKTREFNNLLKSEMDKRKNKYFKKKCESPVEIHILHVKDERWTNEIVYERCYFCYEEKRDSTWFQIDESDGWNYQMYELVAMEEELMEITKDEYDNYRKEIVDKVNLYKLKKLEEEKNAILGEDVIGEKSIPHNKSGYGRGYAMRDNREYDKKRKGCGKEFDIISYGYVKCGELYHNISGKGDSRIVYCKECREHDKGEKIPSIKKGVSKINVKFKVSEE